MLFRSIAYSKATDNAGNTAITTIPFTTGQAAIRVLGQGNSFTTNTANNGGLSASSLSNPATMTFDSSGNLWTTDLTNNRILRYPAPFSNGMAANLVLGQSSFTTNAAGTTSSTLNGPNGPTFDSSGNLWVPDRAKDRKSVV